MQLDLNLLTALDALLEEGSVAGAADRLHLTAPAVSRALGRIRRVMGDEILVRTGRTMTPTPRALAVRAQVHALVQQAQLVLSSEHDLDLTTLDRTFTLKGHDAVVNTIGPDLLAAVRAQAPGVRLRLLAEADTDTDELRHGHVDLEIGSNLPVSADIRHDVMASDRLVVAVPADHPAHAFTLENYVGAEHITVSRRGRLHDPIDDLLSARGLTRRVVATVPTVAAALRFVRRGDLVTTVPERMTGAAAAELGLRLMPLPLEPISIPMIVAWHQRYDGDRAHTWLREQLRAAIYQAVGRPDKADNGQQPPIT
ncbi:LysR family transcriptional regulator [Nocardia sp. NPDC051321]|uniref:LysR family transcriptional regulator n=1 Tax=Nocardia sp. NPDC051321 TaxID=3364323 RepID=UPI003787DC3B